LSSPKLSSPKPKTPIGYIELRVFSHATEDPQKVEVAVKNILPEKLAEEIVFTKTSLTGHHGNPIVLIQAELTDKAALPAVLEKIAAGLSVLDKQQLCEGLKLYMEKHNLFLRLDKQSAFLGILKLTANDPIHLKIHFKNKTPTQIEEICTQAGLIA
jgi:RNA-binding protein